MKNTTPIETIIKLERLATKFKAKAKQFEALFEQAVDSTYGLEIGDKLAEKIYGTVSVKADQTHIIKATAPKKVEWDQSKLEEMYNELHGRGATPDDFIKREIYYTIPEKEYDLFTSKQKEYFGGARTVKIGKIKYEIKEA